MSNVDSKSISYKERMIKLEIEKRNIAEDIRELSKEMKSVGFSATEVTGIKLAVRRYFETEDAKAKRVSAEEFAESLGDFKDLPLGVAAVSRHSFDG